MVRESTKGTSSRNHKSIGISSNHDHSEADMSRRILLLLLLWGSFSPGEHLVDSKCVMSESNVASFHPCIARVNARLKTVPCAYSTSECAAPTVPTASRVQATVIPSAGDSTGGDEQISDIVLTGSSESGSSRCPDSW